MCLTVKIIAVEVLILLSCNYRELVADENVEENISNHQTKHISLNRVKRQGGGGIIAFRPLFVYRQQQKEQQEKYKEIEAQKKLKQEQLLQYQRYQEQYQQYQQYQRQRETHKPQAQPLPQYSSYPSIYQSYSTKYQNYPTTYDRYPSYEEYSTYDKYPTYYETYAQTTSQPFNLYQTYYDDSYYE